MIKSNHRIDFLMLTICQSDYVANDINHWWEVNGYIIGFLYIKEIRWCVRITIWLNVFL